MTVTITTLNLAVVLVGSFLCMAAQKTQVESSSLQEIGKLAAGQSWEEIVRLLESVHSRTADMDFAYGMALARIGRWLQAESALQEGRRLAPADARFSIELAGIAFQQRQYARAAGRLQAAVRLAPSDSYANDFLGTIYYLEGNTEASLKYWNRVGKPEIVEVREAPLTSLSPALFDKAFAFAPASTLMLSSYLDTNARIRGLGVFPQYHFDLVTREDGKFDVVFRSQERDGFGGSKWESLFLLLHGLPFQSLDPQYYNLHRNATNIVSSFRWDPQKRRIAAQISGPWEHTAKYRYELVSDLRNENWALRDSFTGPAPVLASLNLRRASVAFDLASNASERMRWSAGAELSYRDFRSVVPGSVLSPEMLAAGYQIKQQAQLTGTLWRVPEHRFTLNTEASSQTARLWSHHQELFEKVQSETEWRWYPRAEGDDYQTSLQVRAGKSFGQIPFDELFVLGLQPENDLPMRAHIGTRDGRKGSAPIGREYFLSSWETDKNIHGNGVLTMKFGPFLDLGKMTDPASMPGPHELLWDTGAQIKVRLFGSGFAISWGRDLRSGNNAFWITHIQ